MNLIFLDIDGVLIRLGGGARKSRSEKTGGLLTEFDDYCVYNLQEILKKTRTKIVISSSWRHNKEQLKKSWLESGLDWNDIISYTPSGLGHGRGNEILTWINQYHKTCKNGYHIKNWIAIDDDSCDMKSIKRLGRFIHTKSNEGLTDMEAKEIIEIFNF